MSSRLPPIQNSQGLVRRATFNKLLADVERTRMVPQRGMVQTTRGTMVRRVLESRAQSWPGYHRIVNVKWYDADIYTGSTAGCQEITDNSTAGAKTYTVFHADNGTVTYEDGPCPEPNPDNEAWIATADIIEPLLILRFG